MRTFLSIIAGCFVMLIAFSTPWALLVLPRDSGDTSPISEVLGVAGFFGIYFLPITLALALIIVWPVELLAVRAKKLAIELSVRALAWFAVSTVYITSIALANPEVRIAAFYCGIFASALTAIAFTGFIGSPQKKSTGRTDA